MEPLRVHIAELVIATDPQTADVTIADSISKAAAAKGLAVVAREVVGDDEALIRAKLEQFIGDPNIDVVIATGRAESAAASNALRPLITSPVPGFTDLFRWLAYQEIGASAMLSNAEAAQCTSTFVFLLPAVKGAVEQAMEKLILPQLDPATQPKNLIQQIPRLATLVRPPPLLPEPPARVRPDLGAVPKRVEVERTASGPGIVARLPSNPVIPAPRSTGKTGPHVLRKGDPDVTKQIDRSELERNLVRSETNPNDAVTKPSIDLRSLLPKRPPGADEHDEHDESDLANVLAGQPSRPKPLTQRSTRKPPTIQIPVKDGATREVRTAPALTHKNPPPAEVISLTELAKSTEARDPDPLTKRAPVKPSTPPPEPTEAIEATEAIEVTEAMAAAAATEAPESPEATELEAAELEPATDAEFEHRTEASQPAIITSASGPTARPRAATTPPPPPPKKKRAATEPPPLFVSDKKQPPRPARTPTEPPKPRDSFNDLPRGKFVFPPQKGLTGARIAKWAVFALLAAGIGIAFVHFFLTKQAPATLAVVIADAPSSVPGDASDATGPSDAAGATEVAAVEPDASITEVEIDVNAAALANAAKPQPRIDGGVESAGSNATTVPPEDPTCDEVSCVLEKYARACCARYKPAETFKPSIPGKMESLDKVMVKEGIEGVKPRVIACGETFATKGTVKVSMTVTPAGGVKETSVEASPDPELGKCVAQALRAATFAKTTKGGTFTYPFVF